MRATGTGAGGATALAQAALRSKRGIAATIEQQEARNVELRARGAQMAQQARLREGARVDLARMRGQEFMFGAREAREIAKMDRVAALADQQAAIGRAERQAMAQGFGMAAGALGGAAAGLAAGEFSFGQKASALGFGQTGSGGGGQDISQALTLASTANALALLSDKRLKKNIKLIGQSIKGINIYSFEYIDSRIGKGVYQGVMSDEVPSYAVHSIGGYDAVDYSKIDVEFKLLKNEL